MHTLCCSEESFKASLLERLFRQKGFKGSGESKTDNKLRMVSFLRLLTANETSQAMKTKSSHIQVGLFTASAKIL